MAIGDVVPPRVAVVRAAGLSYRSLIIINHSRWIVAYSNDDHLLLTAEDAAEILETLDASFAR